MANFLKKAIKRPGAMTAKAKAAGQSNYEYAQSKQHASGTDGDEARLYMNVLRKVGPKSRKKSPKEGSAAEEKGESAATEKKEMAGTV